MTLWKIIGNKKSIAQQPAPQSLPTLRKNKELEGRVTMKINKIESLKYSAKSGSDGFRNCGAGNAI